MNKLSLSTCSTALLLALASPLLASNSSSIQSPLASTGLDVEILAYQWIPFGPVLSARAQWLEDTGRLESGRREEELVVIRADKASNHER